MQAVDCVPQRRCGRGELTCNALVSGEPHAEAQALPVLVRGRVADVLAGPHHLEARRCARVEPNPPDFQVREIKDRLEVDDAGLLHLAVGVAIDAVERTIPRVELQQRVTADTSAFTYAHDKCSMSV